MKKISIFSLICFLTLSIFFAYKILIVNHISEDEEKLEIVVDKPYLSAIKEIVTKNSLEKIAEKNNSKVIEKKWDYLNLEMPRIIRPKTWHVNGKLIFSTYSKNEDFGELKLNFVQDVDIEKDILLIKTYLKEPSENVLEYKKEIKIQPFENKIKLFLLSKIKIQKTIPDFFSKYMDDKVKIYNKIEIENLKNELLNIINSSTSTPFIKIK